MERTDKGGSYVQLEFYAVLTCKEAACVLDIVVVHMHVAQEQCYRLEGEVYVPGHEVEVVYVGLQPEVRVGAALVGRHYKFPVLDLELHERQAWRLAALGLGSAEEQHIVL